MEVFRSAQALSADIGETVVDTWNVSNSRRWIGVDEDCDAGVIVINGAGGAGVDIFFSLLIEHKDAANLENYMVFLDQRKREAKDTLAMSTAKSFIAKARKAYRGHTQTAVRLFGLFPRAIIPPSDLAATSFFCDQRSTDESIPWLLMVTSSRLPLCRCIRRQQVDIGLVAEDK
jgi:hypothetical protein